jgi:hypothetical protein
MAGAYRGVCSVCDGDYAITVKNVIGRHPAPSPEFADEDGRCLGSAKPPKGKGVGKPKGKSQP